MVEDEDQFSFIPSQPSFGLPIPRLEPCREEALSRVGEFLVVDLSDLAVVLYELPFVCP